MNRDTIAALNRVNRDFYYRLAREFSQTREHPWPGWERVIDCFHDRTELARRGRATPIVKLASKRNPGARVEILDVGCGNGRFGVLLAGERTESLAYLGVDASAPLLAIARRRLAARGGLRTRWVCSDLVESEWPFSSRELAVDGVVVFGVLHHIAGLESRRSLLSRLAGLLRPGGLVAVSFWQFGDRPRFRERVVSWEQYNREAERPIAAKQLESGDYLLAWGDAGARRYCHHATPEEAQMLVSSAGFEIVDSFRADGRSGDLNLYFVLRRSKSTEADLGSKR